MRLQFYLRFNGLTWLSLLLLNNRLPDLSRTFFQFFCAASRHYAPRTAMTEDEQSLLDAKLQSLADKIASHPLVTLTYFQPDKKKTGGAYICVTGQLKKIDDYEGVLVLMGGERILIEDILDIR